MFRKISVLAASTVLSMSVLCLLFLAGCSHNSDPFSYVKVSGKVTYEDGSLIPADRIILKFMPENAPVVGNLHPRGGLSNVDVKTGEFKSVTSHTPRDGLVPGKHKVIITGDDNVPLPASIVPEDYADFKTTPLEVDTEYTPFHLKVTKPAPGSGAQ